MAKSRLKENIFRLIPSCIMKRIDRASYSIEEFVFSISEEIPPGCKVLDAGSGEARFKRFFKKHKYVAIDTKWGDSTWDYSNLDLMGDLTNLPIEEGVFDGIICTQVLEHVREPEIVISEMYRVLKKGKKIYISAPQGWGVHQAPDDYFRFTCYGLQYLLEKVGFKVLSIIPSCGYFGYLANRLTVFPKALFWHVRTPWLRIVMFPLELLSYFFFVLVFPLLLNAMDFLDRRRDYTLNYFVRALKLNE